MSQLLTLFTRASKLMRHAADEAMSRHGVRVGQNIVLAVLWEEDGLTPGELAERVHMTTPTIVNTASRMESAGLITRKRDTEDRRLVRLYLTDHAREVRTAIEHERHQLELRATATLTSEERAALESALRKIIDVMSEDQ